MRSRNTRQRALFLALLGLLVACGTDDVRPPPAELQDFEATVTFRQAWSRDVGDGIGEHLPDLRPYFRDGELFTIDHEGLLTELDPETGDRVREFDWDRSVTAGVAGYADVLYAVDGDGLLFAWNQASEEELWTQQLTSEVVVVPVAADDKVITLTGDGRVAAYGASDGLPRWEYLIPTEPALTLRGSARPAIYGNTIIFGLSDGRVISLSLSDGELLWEQRAAIPRGRTELERLVDVDGDLLLQGSRLFAVAFQGRLVELSPYDGQVIWAVDASSYSNLAGDSDILVISSPEGDLVAFRRNSGEELWRTDLLSYRYLESPVLWRDWVMVSDLEGYVHAFDRLTGEIAGRFRPGDDDGIRAPMTVWNDHLVIFNNSGDISAWRVQE